VEGNMKVSSATDIQIDASTFLLYAPPGMGKTSTIKYLEGKTLYVPLDKTHSVLKGCENIDIVDFNSHQAWEEWNALMRDLARTDLSKYDNLVFDNISELTRSMLGNLGRDGKNNRVPSMANYQQIDFFIIDSVRFIQTLGKRVVFTAWETTDKWELPSGQAVNRSYPDMRDKILNNFMGLCHVVGKLVINPETQKRGFILEPTDYLFAKNQLDDRKACSQENIFKVGHVPSTDNKEEK